MFFKVDDVTGIRLNASAAALVWSETYTISDRRTLQSTVSLPDKLFKLKRYILLWPVKILNFLPYKKHLISLAFNSYWSTQLLCRRCLIKLSQGLFVIFVNDEHLNRKNLGWIPVALFNIILIFKMQFRSPIKFDVFFYINYLMRVIK